MLNPTVRDHWIIALTGGEFQQTQHQLRRDAGRDGYCCLGVLCELYRRETGEGNWSGDLFVLDYRVFASLPPAKVLCWAEMERTDAEHLAGMNDGDGMQDFGRSFQEIAKIIAAK